MKTLSQFILEVKIPRAVIPKLHDIETQILKHVTGGTKAYKKRHGHFSTVFVHKTKNHAIKVNPYEIDGYSYFIKNVLKAKKGNPFLPKIKKVIKLRVRRGAKTDLVHHRFMISKVEKLQPAHKAKVKEIEQKRIVSAFGAGLRDKQWVEKNHWAMHPKYRKHLKNARKTYRKAYNYDIQPNNVMYRKKDGMPVITDPLS